MAGGAPIPFYLGDLLMDRLEFVDTHVHFYDMQHPELVYDHWQPGVPHPTLGDGRYRSLPNGTISPRTTSRRPETRT